MKKRYFLFAAFLACVLLFCGCKKPATEERAAERVEEYEHAINYDYENPSEIYNLLCSDVRSQISEEDFCTAWEKERTYPYLTPLYIFYPEITMNDDGLSGSAHFIRAARIEGMYYDVSFVYENGDWYFDDWHQFIDGSYLEKFEDCPYDISWYFNSDPNES